MYEILLAADIWQNPIFVPIFISIASALGGAIILDIYLHLKTQGKKTLNKRKEERKQELTEIVKPCIEDTIKPLDDKLTGVESQMKTIANNDLPLLKQANRDSLRNQLLALYRHCAKQNYRSIEDTRNWEAMFESYKALGGNGFMLEIETKFLKIPLKDLALTGNSIIV